LRAFGDAHWDVHEVIEAGDRVITRWTGRGTHTADLMAIRATRKQVSVDGIWIHRFADGKIVESWNAWDMLGLLQQIGAVPPIGEAK
jgi:predicted ester cyclase